MLQYNFSAHVLVTGSGWSEGKFTSTRQGPTSSNEYSICIQKLIEKKTPSHYFKIHDKCTVRQSNGHIHKRHVPSAPALTHHGSFGCQSTSSTPSSPVILWPLRTFRGTIVALLSISPVTLPWKIWREPSSLASANRG